MFGLNLYSQSISGFATENINKDTGKANEEALNSSENKQISTMEGQSYSAVLKETQDKYARSMEKSEKSSKTYGTLSQVGFMVGAVYLAQYASCSGTCYPALVKSMMGFGAGIAFNSLSNKSSKMAKESCDMQMEACNVYNQSNTEKMECTCEGTGAGAGGAAGGGAGGGPEGLEMPNIADLYDESGNCLASAPPECQSIGAGAVAAIKSPTGCKVAGKPVSCLAAMNSTVTKNPDGSLTVKGPKGDINLSASDFTDPNALAKLGLSAADAAKMAANFKDTLSKDNIDAELKKGDGKKLFSDSLGRSGGSLSADRNKNTGGNFSDKLGDSKRKPSAEGLTKDYNGDLIGAAGDDIFTMMNRRYKLKTEQDSFIAP